MSEVLEAPVAAKSAPTKQLSERALVVQLSISKWTARKYDAKVSKKVEEENEAKGDAGRYNKALIAKEQMRELQQIESKLRKFHYFNTLPWNDNGERLLPSANYITYVNELNKLRAEFDTAVQEFLANYDHYVQDARNRLGKMFNINDYPSDKEIVGKFRVKPVFFKVPDTDFRIGLSNTEAAKLKTAAELEITERLNTAMKDAWTRIKEQLSNMKERLSEKDAIFRNSLFTNMQELVSVLPRLNITGDLNLQKICDEIENLVSVDPDTVRSDDTIRDIKAQQVEDIMERFKDFF